MLKIQKQLPFNIMAMTPRGTLGLYFVRIAQLMTHPHYLTMTLPHYTLPFTLQIFHKPLGRIQRVTKIQKVYISSHDVLQILHHNNFGLYRSQSFQRWYRVTRIRVSQILQNYQKNFKEILNQPIHWFEEDYMNLNTGKCHLLIFGHKYKHQWAQIGKNMVWEEI